MRRLLALVAMVPAVAAAPALATSDAEYPEYSGADFVALYDHAVANLLPNLDPPGDRFPVTGDPAVDDRIWELAMERGYVLRHSASGDLVSVEGVPMQPEAAEAWIGLRADARAAGMHFIVSSAYRSPEAQRSQFLSMLRGTSDSAINAALTWWSIPGASKHHGGYALDFRHADGTFGQFRSTPDYAWLAADNFAVPKRHGLIPSYPDDVADQGPNPEPWEFVWVGTHLIRCGLPQDLGAVVPGPAAAIVHDIERCPGGPDPVGLPDWLDR